MPVFRPLICLLLIAIAASGQAALDTTVQLYSFEQVVPDQSQSTREAAVGDALAQVLVRVTGDRGIASTPAGKALLGQADSLLDQYSYAQRAPPALPANATAPVAQPAQPPDGAATTPPVQPVPPLLVLQGRFNARNIRMQLRTAGQALWPQPRAQLNMLLLVNDGGISQLSPEPVAAADTQASAPPPTDTAAAPSGAVGPTAVDAAEILATVASSRGLRISLLAPLPESAADLWQQPVLSLPQAAGLASDALLLVGRLTHVKDSWSADWTLLQGNQQLDQWSQFAPALPEVLTVGAHRAVDWMAQRYAVRSGPGEDNAIALQVLGVNSLADYARVQRYLQQLDPVQSLALLRVAGDALEYRLHVDGGIDALTRTLRLGGLLLPTPQSNDTDQPGWGGGVHRTYTLRAAPGVNTP